MKVAFSWFSDVVASPWESCTGELDNHLGGDIEALLEHQRQHQGDHGENQEDTLHPLLGGEEDPEELMRR